MAVDFCHNIWRDAAGGEALVLKLADCGQVLGKDHGLFLQIGNGNTGKTSLRILEWECLGMAFWNGKNQFLCLEQHAFKRKRRISGQRDDGHVQFSVLQQADQRGSSFFCNFYCNIRVGFIEFADDVGVGYSAPLWGDANGKASGFCLSHIGQLVVELSLLLKHLFAGADIQFACRSQGHFVAPPFKQAYAQFGFQPA